MAQVLRIGVLVRPGDTAAEIAVDPADDRALEAAAEAKADVIVSGDRPPPAAGNVASVRVERAADFLAGFG